MVSPTLQFDATLRTTHGWAVLRLPEKVSKKVPSRGQVAARGTINGRAFRTVLEPDGNFGHWMTVDAELQKAADRARAPRPDGELTPRVTTSHSARARVPGARQPSRRRGAA